MVVVVDVVAEGEEGEESEEVEIEEEEEDDDDDETDDETDGEVEDGGAEAFPTSNDPNDKPAAKAPIFSAPVCPFPLFATRAASGSLL